MGSKDLAKGVEGVPLFFWIGGLIQKGKGGIGWKEGLTLAWGRKGRAGPI